MANSSNKNFPHAYGAGRVIAAFQLAHSGGAPAPTTADDLSAPAQPAALADNSLAGTFPYPWPDGFPWVPDLSVPSMADKGFAAWNVERMPYNATNMGVFAVGSGTAPFPYRQILLQESTSGHPPIDDKIPSDGLYPFETAQQLGLGTSNAQFVAEVDVGEGVSEEAGGRYMVALDWDLPESTITYTLGDPVFPPDEEVFFEEGVVQGWSTNEQVSVTNALRRSCWCVATPTRYLPQINPLAAPTTDEATLKLPQAFGSESVTRYEAGGQVWGIQRDLNVTPILDESVATFSNEFIWVNSLNCFTRATVRANLRSLTYQYINKNGERAGGLQPWEDPLPGDQLKWTQQYQAVVDIEALAPSEDGPGLSSAPRPLPWFVGEVATAINVMVIQKNSSAPDGTDGGMYCSVPFLAAPGGARLEQDPRVILRRTPVKKTTTENT